MSASDNGHKEKMSQIDPFKQVAREHAANGDEEYWDERFKKMVKVTPNPRKPDVKPSAPRARSAF